MKNQNRAKRIRGEKHSELYICDIIPPTMFKLLISSVKKPVTVTHFALIACLSQPGRNIAIAKFYADVQQ